MVAQPITNALPCTAIASPFSGGPLIAQWLLWTLVALAVLACIALVALQFVKSVPTSARLGGMCAVACCVFTVLATVILLPPILRPSKPTHTSDTLAPQPGKDNVGLAFSGGSLSGGLDAMCYLHALDSLVDGRLRDSTASKLAVSTVSGGSLGYFAWRQLVMVYPKLTPDWTVDQLLAWPAPSSLPPGVRPFSAVPLLTASLPELVETVRQCIGGDLKACEELDLFAKDANQTSSSAATLSAAYGAAPESPAVTLEQVVDTVTTVLTCLKSEALWPCAAEGFAAVQGVTDARTAPPGPLRWLVQFSLINAFFSTYGGVGVPLPIDSIGKDVAVGTLDNNPRARHNATLSGTPSFAPSGLHLFGGLWGTLARWVLPTLDAAQPVNLFDAVTYSSDFLSFRTPFINTSNSETCDFGMVDDLILKALGPNASAEEECTARAKWRQQYTASQTLLGSWTSRPDPGALGTDGGVLDTQGMVSLLRARAKNVVAFWEDDVPFTTSHGLSPLFGILDSPSSDLCDGASPALGAELMQVFDSSLWPTVDKALSDPAGPNVVVLNDVHVRENAFLGVSAYTIGTLVIFGNGPSEQFNAYMAGDSAAAGGSATAPPSWLPYLPSTWPAIEGFGITPFQANTKCLLAQWKVANSGALLKEMLDAALHF